LGTLADAARFGDAGMDRVGGLLVEQSAAALGGGMERGAHNVAVAIGRELAGGIAQLLVDRFFQSAVACR
jgi:hypothetical protein